MSEANARGDVRSDLFRTLSEIHRQSGLQELLDFTCERVVESTGWVRALLTFYLDEDAFIGACGCPVGTREKFLEVCRSTPLAGRQRKRAELIEHVRPDTNICFLPAGSGPRAAATGVPTLESRGSWHPSDRLIILMRGWEGEILGTLSLDGPPDGNRPDEAEYTRLEVVDRFAGIVGKIAENRYLSLRLKESEAAYRGMFHFASDAMLIFDAKGKIVEANPAACRLMEGEYDEIIGLHGDEIAHPSGATRFPAAIDRSAMPQEFDADHRLLSRKGNTREVDIRWSTVNYHGAPHLLAQIRDETRRKRSIGHFLEQQKEESIVAVAGGVAHDTNNILMGITGSLGLLERSLPSDAEALKHCERIGFAASRLSRLAGQLLAVSRGAQSELRALSLDTVLGDVRDEVRELAHPGTTVEFESPAGLWLVEADQLQVSQLVLNLAENACESMGPAGTLTVTAGNVTREKDWIGYRGEVYPAGEYAALIVKDSGTGLDDRTAKRLFDPYFSTKSTGRGLGLTVVLGIVRRHRAAISVISRPDEGTRVEILFPRHVRVEESAPGEPAAAVVAEPARTALVVDDDDMVLEVTQALIESLGWSTLPARSGEEALGIFQDRSREIRFCVIDVRLPGMSGLDLTEEILGHNQNTRVILASGYTEEQVRERFASGGRISAFLQKPYTMRELERVIRKAVGTSEADSGD